MLSKEKLDLRTRMQNNKYHDACIFLLTKYINNDLNDKDMLVITRMVYLKEIGLHSEGARRDTFLRNVNLFGSLYMGWYCKFFAESVEIDGVFGDYIFSEQGDLFNAKARIIMFHNKGDAQYVSIEEKYVNHHNRESQSYKDYAELQ